MLIRFEDKYGIARFYYLSQNLKFDKNIEGVESVSDSVFTEKGVSITKVFDSEHVSEMISRGFTDFALVYDVDHQESNNKVLSAEFLKLKADKLKDLPVNFHFIPVVYTAETIALLQYAQVNFPLANLVHSRNTKGLHLSLLQDFADPSGNLTKKQIKKYEGVDIESLREALLRFRDIDPWNKYVIKLLLENDYTGLSIDEAIDFQRNLESHFYSLVSSNKNGNCQFKIKRVGDSVMIDYYNYKINKK